QSRGTLELHGVGRLAHLVLEAPDDLLRVPVEEVDQLVDQVVVLLAGRLSDARAATLLDVEEQARPSLAVVAVELVVRARADGERAEEEVEGLADGVGVAVGAEVPRAL